MWIVLLLLTLSKFIVGEPPWWNTAVYYRILLDSFKDADSDGLGDLNGATKQISYVRALGADAVIMSPLSVKSTDCSKPGVIDLAEIDVRYGTLNTLNAFLEKVNKLELKVVISLPLQTISTASECFNSSADKIVGYEDRIVWQDGTGNDIPPLQNGIDDWIWHENRAAYYGVRDNEAILNLCSEAVAAALASAQCAWLRRGFSGVLLNPDYEYDQNCAWKLVQKMAAEAIICARSSNLEIPVILVESSLDAENASKYYGDGGVGANSVLSTALTFPTKQSSPGLALSIHATLLYTPRDSFPTWTTSMPYESRITTRYGGDSVDAINLLALMLPGAAVIQQGDELGVADTILEWASSNATCWPSRLLPSSAPFPWSDAANGGFTSGEPWLPLAPNYRYANAKSEFVNDNSHAGVLKVAAAMRKSPAMGPHVEIKRLGDAIAVLRWGGHGSLLLVANLGKMPSEEKLSAFFGLPNEISVAASSASSSFPVRAQVAVDKSFKLTPGETLLLAGGPRHCGGPGPVDKIANKLSEGWQKINKYFSMLAKNELLKRYLQNLLFSAWLSVAASNAVSRAGSALALMSGGAGVRSPARRGLSARPTPAIDRARAHACAPCTDATTRVAAIQNTMGTIENHFFENFINLYQ
ncbi:unnamed protein product [Diatraea saccharalis]|uniref:alpha-glucosidase n=1 Tax=Diatraea saccharalis TaxID=40085 RepID=A0A9N9QWP8_9NEOP|nr:unnamed protein product [Diatraea saccharalis]